MLYSILWLRVCVCIAYVLSLSTAVYAGFHSPGMISTFSWSSLGLIVNCVNIVRFLYLKRDAEIPDDLKALYKKYFLTLRPREFLALFASATLKKAKNEEVLIEQNKPTDLLLLVDGTLQIMVDKHVVNTISNTTFLGDMSYMANIDVTASVICMSEVTYYQWEKEKLNKLNKKIPHVYQAFKQILSLSIVNKVIASNKNLSLSKKKKGDGTDMFHMP